MEDELVKVNGGGITDHNVKILILPTGPAGLKSLQSADSVKFDEAKMTFQFQVSNYRRNCRGLCSFLG